MDNKLTYKTTFSKDRPWQEHTNSRESSTHCQKDDSQQVKDLMKIDTILDTINNSTEHTIGDEAKRGMTADIITLPASNNKIMIFMNLRHSKRKNTTFNQNFNHYNYV